MSLRIVRTTDVNDDLFETGLRMGRLDPRRGERFVTAFESTAARIAVMPGIGSPYPVTNPRLVGLRRVPIQRFKDYQLFYLAGPEELVVVRVLHGSRDIRAILERES